ncbi:hypothetical protein SUDANB121_00165 [Nocardiopsis dassonvillei]|uniref:hypothetical protein n=1 Tax=Nocardiopsis dassonvillei TaxID=2014 RepID=UPI003F560FFC
MSTTPEDNTGQEPEGTGQPTFEPAADVAEAPRTPGAEHTGEEHPVGEDGGEAAAAPARRGAFSAETFALVGLALLVVTIQSGQLVELLTGMVLVGGQPIAAEQISQIRTQILAGGALALLAALAFALSLLLGNAASRPWAKWVATAGVIVGVLFMLAGAAAFLLIPEAAPPQPMMPPF